MATKAKERKTDKKAQTVAGSLQAVKFSPIMQEGAKSLQAFFTKFSMIGP